MRKEKTLAPSLVLFFIVLTFANIDATFALPYEPFNGYQIKDLTSTNFDRFAFETQGWTISGLTGSANSSLCGSSNPILAGYDTFDNNLALSKNYMSLPMHNAIYYQITFNFIDKFKNPDYFTLTLGSTSIAGGSSLKTYNPYVTSNICGGSDSDTTQFMITGSMPHTANTLNFQLTAKASTGSGSGTLGIRDIQLTFVNDTSITSSTSCFRVYDTQLFGLSGECPCVKGSYYNAGSCSTCDPSCIDCSGPSTSQCYACASGYSWGGNQCIQCDSSCATCTGTNSLQCVTCKDGYWLQKNGSCTTTCDLPAFARQVVGSLQVCSSGCASHQFTLWNRSCASNCTFPLVASTLDSNQLCNQPCQNNEYLYWNNSCLSTCPSPLISSVGENGVLLCQKPCLNNGFLYPNGSCLDECRSPLVSNIVDGVEKCSSPCANQSDYYYTANSVCGAHCLSPNTIHIVEFLKICSWGSTTTAGDLSGEDKKFVDQAKTVTETAGKTTTVGVIASSLLSSRNSNAITLISLVKMLEYIRYINIDYPAKLQYMLDSQKKSSVSLNFDVEFPEGIQEKFPNYPLPDKFGEYNLKSNFILNYSAALFTFTALLGILAISMMLALRLQSMKYLGTICRKIRDIIKWNFLLIVLCENIESVGVYSSLEFRTTHFNSFVSVFGTLICCFVNLLILYLILSVPYIIYSLRRESRKVLPLTTEMAKSEEEDKNKRFESCGVLFMNFKEKSVWQHSCMFFILIRVYLFYLIIGYLFEYPLAQAILITLMSILMLGYLSISRPFKNKLELLKNITYESIIALVNLCVLIMTIIERKNIDNEGMKTKLGDIIIMTNTIFNLMALLFIMAEVIIKLVKVYKLRKTVREKGWKYWIKIATILLEPEEMEHSKEHQTKPEISASATPGKTILLKQEKLVERDSISENLIFDVNTDPRAFIRPNSSSLTRVPSNKNRIFPSQSISSLNGFLPSTKNTMNLLRQGVPSPTYEESQSRLNSFRTLLSSSQVSFQEVELQKLGSENLLNKTYALYESPKEMIEKKRKLSKRRTSIRAHENLVDYNSESDANTPKGQRSLIVSPKNSKISMKSSFKPN